MVLTMYLNLCNDKNKKGIILEKKETDKGVLGHYFEKGNERMAET